MSIFNSLGSNYSLSFILRTLFVHSDEKKNLLTLLKKKYQGKPILFYKGREAIAYGLSLLKLPKGTQIAITGYTCIAVYNAVIHAGYEPVYLDIDCNNLNYSSEILQNAIVSHPSIRVVLIQNTLGFSSDIEPIENLCKKYGLILIEDLAHSVGSHYSNGKETGTIGDMVILSFSQDKMIDGISGGALIIRNRKYEPENKIDFSPLSQNQQLKDRFYPFFTYCIRNTYSFYLGKFLHLAFRSLHLLSQPINSRSSFLLHNLPSWYTESIYLGFKNLEKNVIHRRKIATIYATTINPQILMKNIEKQVQSSANLRFPIFTIKRKKIIDLLQENNIYVSDIWYDSPIAPKRYQTTTSYAHECPTAEFVALRMLNLPTHRNISEKKAHEIAARINIWIKEQ